MVSTPLTHINQLGLLFPIFMESHKSHVPNHQPGMVSVEERNHACQDGVSAGASRLVLPLSPGHSATPPNQPASKHTKRYGQLAVYQRKWSIFMMHGPCIFAWIYWIIYIYMSISRYLSWFSIFFQDLLCFIPMNISSENHGKSPGQRWQSFRPSRTWTNRLTLSILRVV